MREIKKDQKYTIVMSAILLFVAITINLLLFNKFSSSNLGGDSQVYHSMALSLLNMNDAFTLDWSEHIFDIGQIVTPFYSALIAIIYGIGGVNPENIYIFNIVLYSLSILILFFISKSITQNIFLSFFLLFCVSFYYVLLKYNFMVLMEISTIFFLTVTIFFISKYYYSKKSEFYWISSGLFSVLVLINNRFVVLLAVFLLFVLIEKLLKKEKFFKGYIVALLIVFLIIAPWFARQYLVYNQFIFFTPLWHNVVASRIGIVKKINVPTDASPDFTDAVPESYDECIEYIVQTSDGSKREQRLTLFTEKKYNQMLLEHNPKENIYLHRLKKYFTLYHSDFAFEGPNDYRVICPASVEFKIIQIFILLPLFVFSFVGMIVSFYKRENKFILLVSLFFISHIVLHVLIHYVSRYLLTAIPFIILLASYGFSETYYIFRNYFENIKLTKIALTLLKNS